MNTAYRLYAENIGNGEDLQNFSESLVQLNPDKNPGNFRDEISIFEVS